MEKANNPASKSWSGGQMQNVVAALQNTTIPPIVPNQGAQALVRPIEAQVCTICYCFSTV